MTIARTRRPNNNAAAGTWHKRDAKSGRIVSKTIRERPASGDRLTKRLDKTIDGVIRDYNDALRRLEEF